MRETSRIIAVIGAISAIILSVIFLIFNPYNGNTTTVPTAMIVTLMFIVPALIVIIGSVKTKASWLFISSVWTLPYSIYMFLTPSIFKLLLLPACFYLVSAILIMLNPKTV